MLTRAWTYSSAASANSGSSSKISVKRERTTMFNQTTNLLHCPTSLLAPTFSQTLENLSVLQKMHKCSARSAMRWRLAIKRFYLKRWIKFKRFRNDLLFTFDRIQQFPRTSQKNTSKSGEIAGCWSIVEQFFESFVQSSKNVFLHNPKNKALIFVHNNQPVQLLDVKIERKKLVPKGVVLVNRLGRGQLLQQIIFFKFLHTAHYGAHFEF